MISNEVLQQPVGSPFEAASTAEEVIAGIDLTGKVAIVTGGYSGIGLENVRVFRQAGAQVIVPTRDHARAVKALEGIDGVEIRQMDLLDPASIDEFATWFLSTNRPLHLLVNSAGIMANPFTLDGRGYEIQFATNHLGHFQLTARLWPALKQANGARVVSVSSRGHRRSAVIFEDLHFEHRAYDGWAAYGQSKTANVLFALALDQRGREYGIRAFSLHPGAIVGTGLGKHLSAEDIRRLGVVDAQGRPIIDPQRQLKTLEQGASTQVWCAVSPLLNGLGGAYCENNEISPVVTPEEVSAWSQDILAQRPGVMSFAVDPEAAERLWQVSEQLTGVILDK
ncbi:SDR family NAD(P)-dependent oxidoreductase [Chitinophaga pendula]|uniref:oxidoreductase n=1 Tax=Chitinophaga TaxID=79328 RepID=UPI000BB0A858|nr:MULTISPECIES: oxidoreductase [Chitinophaga]ASZ14758.1 oxidoreductase [Chitinophaga sp. MD30]UCJ07401.1 SDR family NAD(P)-dependent oxidoreductase [Chitinophaga pendula]